LLFDLASDKTEQNNLILQYPERAGELKTRLEEWTRELDPPGMPAHQFIPVEGQYYNFYFNLE
jgi:hypothetical protein